jgi:hypothetical protein
MPPPNLPHGDAGDNQPITADNPKQPGMKLIAARAVMGIDDDHFGVTLAHQGQALIEPAKT